MKTFLLRTVALALASVLAAHAQVIDGPPRALGDVPQHGIGVTVDSTQAASARVPVLAGSQAPLPRGPTDGNPDNTPPPTGMPSGLGFSCYMQLISAPGVTESMRQTQGKCSQAGAWTGTPGVNARWSAAFSVGDTTVTGTSFDNHPTYATSFADPSKWGVKWSGDCVGTGLTCTAPPQPVDFGNVPQLKASAVVTYLPTGETTTFSITALFGTCGVMVGGKLTLCN